MNEQNDLITAYLDGTLPQDARAEFERLLLSDGELRGSLEAERLIRETVRKERAAIPSVSGSPSSALLARLEATGTSAVAGTGATGVIGTIFGTSLGLSIVTVVGGLGLLLGLFLAPSLFDERLLPAAMDKQKTAVRSGRVRDADRGNRTDDSAGIVRPFGSADAGERESSSPVTSQSRIPSSKKEVKDNPTDRLDSSDMPARESEVEKRNAMIEYLRREGGTEELPVVRSDSVRLNLKLDPDR